MFTVSFSVSDGNVRTESGKFTPLSDRNFSLLSESLITIAFTLFFDFPIILVSILPLSKRIRSPTAKSLIT